MVASPLLVFTKYQRMFLCHTLKDGRGWFCSFHFDGYGLMDNLSHFNSFYTKSSLQNMFKAAADIFTEDEDKLCPQNINRRSTSAHLQAHLWKYCLTLKQTMAWKRLEYQGIRGKSYSSDNITSLTLVSNRIKTRFLYFTFGKVTYFVPFLECSTCIRSSSMSVISRFTHLYIWCIWRSLDNESNNILFNT